MCSARSGSCARRSTNSEADVGHLTDDDLVLHHYGEPVDAERVQHLRDCAECARAYASLSRTLSTITVPLAPDPEPAFWVQVRERATERLAGRTRRLALLVWLVPIVYPFAVRAVFYSGQLERTNGATGLPLMILALAWAFAGPIAALAALNAMKGGWTNRLEHRFITLGAIAATVSPALFNLTNRTGLGLYAWFGAVLVAAALSLIPIPQATGSTPRLRFAHRVSALVIVTFALAHVANHLLAIVSVSAHSAVLDILRVVYRQRLIEMGLLAAIAFQVASGGTLVWRAQSRRPTTAMSVQMLSGVYLAVFFVAHISAALMARPDTDTNFVWAAGRNGLLASRGLTLLLPYYVLGVVAIFVHAGHYLRLLLFRIVPPATVRRLSYAGMGVTGALAFTIGLALCGVHLLP